MSFFRVTPAQLEQFDEEGFFIVPNLLHEKEVRLLCQIARADHELQQKRGSRADGEGGAVDLVVENDLPSDTIYGAIVRSERIVHAMETVLFDEVYHYHHKMILKEPRVGGAWAWHQDYGYWYNNGCLFPHLASCMIALDKATPENGCLQVLRGSHHIGRIDHVKIGEQTGADPERVQIACRQFDLVHCKLEPGAGIFFDCNLLHRSDQNKSDNPRWAFIGCYNAKHNDPYKDSRHPRYTPLERWPDERVEEVGKAHWSRLSKTASS